MRLILEDYVEEKSEFGKSIRNKFRLQIILSFALNINRFNKLEKI